MKALRTEQTRETNLAREVAGHVLEELFVRDAVLVLLCPGFSRKEGREFLVEVDEVLCILSSFELVLFS